MPRRNWIRYAAVFALGLTVAAAGFYSLGLTGTGLAGAYSPSYAAVAMTFKGEYVKGDYYQPGDVVTFSGSTYVAQAETLDDPFSGPWTMLAQAGPAGPQGPKGDPGNNGLVSGWEQVEKNFTLSPGTRGSATPTCPATKRFVAGGWYQTDSSGRQFTVSMHLANAQTISVLAAYQSGGTGGVGAGYAVVFQNTGQYLVGITVYATCVNA